MAMLMTNMSHVVLELWLEPYNYQYIYSIAVYM